LCQRPPAEVGARTEKWHDASFDEQAHDELEMLLEGVGTEVKNELATALIDDEAYQLVRQLASKRQVTPGELLEVGLASPRQRGGVYDRFRERVIFPDEVQEMRKAVSKRLSDQPELNIKATLGSYSEEAKLFTVVAYSKPPGTRSAASLESKCSSLVSNKCRTESAMIVRRNSWRYASSLIPPNDEVQLRGMTGYALRMQPSNSN
jgi:hypothetical protein